MAGLLWPAVQLRDFWLRRARPTRPPLRLWVDITSRCNLRCTACPQRLLTPGQRRDMDPHLLASLVEQVAAGAAAEVNLFHRGEPLLHPELHAWAGRFKQAGALVRVHSNATLLTPQKITGLLASGLDILTLSIDSLDPDDYAAARPGASLERALAGLEALLKARGIGRGPRISLLLMGRQRHQGRARGVVKRLKALGLDRVIWRAAHNWAGVVGEMPSQQRLHACTFPWYGLAVLSDGRVTPCPQDFMGDLTLGRAQDESLLQIWQGGLERALRRAHATGDLSAHPPCAACDRPRRSTLLGLPSEHLKNFLAESIVSSPRLGRN